MSVLTKKEKTPSAVTQTDEPPRQYVTPEVNIYETDKCYTLEAEMPGVTKDKLEISLEGNSLTLVGHGDAETPKATLVYRESRPADFRRVFELDPAIDASRIRAEMNQGVLILELPKAEAVRPRRIAVE